MIAVAHRGWGRDHDPDDDPRERACVVRRAFRQDLAHWVSSHPRTALRVLRLVEEVMRDPFTGTGKPEPLRHDRGGEWSRRITQSDRLIYMVVGRSVVFVVARGHYTG